MIRSMTGFGHARFEVRASASRPGARRERRHLDVRIRLHTGSPRSRRRAPARRRTARPRQGRSLGGRQTPTGDAVALDLRRRRAVPARGAGLREARHRRRARRAQAAQPARRRACRQRELPQEGVRRALAEGIAPRSTGSRRARGGGASLDRELRGRLERIDVLVVAIEARSGDVQRAVREATPQACRPAARGDQPARRGAPPPGDRLRGGSPRHHRGDGAPALHVEQFRAILDAAGPADAGSTSCSGDGPRGGRSGRGNDAPIAHPDRRAEDRGRAHPRAGPGR